MRTLVAGWAVVAWLVAGCGLIADATTGPPRPCGDVYSTQRCLAMTDAAAADAGRTRDDVTTTIIVPDPPLTDGMIRTSPASINVRVTFADGTDHTIRMCGGIPTGPACMDQH